MKHKTLTWVSLGICALQCGCGAANTPNPNVTGSGVSSSEQRDLPAFSSVELYGVGTMTVEPGEDHKLTVEADDNMLNYVQSSVESRKLRVGVGPGTYVWKTGYPRIVLHSSGAGAYSLTGQTGLVLKQFDKDSLDIRADGQCSVRIFGEIDTLTLNLAGQSSVDASNATIKVITGKLDGQSKVMYKGDVDVQVRTNPGSSIEKVSAN